MHGVRRVEGILRRDLPDDGDQLEAACLEKRMPEESSAIRREIAALARRMAGLPEVKPKRSLPEEVTSYRLGRDGPAPRVVMEALSTRTYQEGDLTEKQRKYQSRRPRAFKRASRNASIAGFVCILAK